MTTKNICFIDPRVADYSGVGAAVLLATLTGAPTIITADIALV
jgi:hypothetical protein